MRVDELFEEKVYSSWIDRIDLINGNSWEEKFSSLFSRTVDVLMTLENGRKYLIQQVPKFLYQQWLRAPSKGKFFHWMIKNRFNINPVR